MPNNVLHCIIFPSIICLTLLSWGASLQLTLYFLFFPYCQKSQKRCSIKTRKLESTIFGCLQSNKDDFELFTLFPCLLGQPVYKTSFTVFRLLQYITIYYNIFQYIRIYYHALQYITIFIVYLVKYVRHPVDVYLVKYKRHPVNERQERRILQKRRAEVFVLHRILGDICKHSSPFLNTNLKITIVMINCTA